MARNTTRETKQIVGFRLRPRDRPPPGLAPGPARLAAGVRQPHSAPGAPGLPSVGRRHRTQPAGHPGPCVRRTVPGPRAARGPRSSRGGPRAESVATTALCPACSALLQRCVRRAATRQRRHGAGPAGPDSRTRDARDDSAFHHRSPEPPGSTRVRVGSGPGRLSGAIHSCAFEQRVLPAESRI